MPPLAAAPAAQSVKIGVTIDPIDNPRHHLPRSFLGSGGCLWESGVVQGLSLSALGRCLLGMQTQVMMIALHAIGALHGELDDPEFR